MGDLAVDVTAATVLRNGHTALDEVSLRVERGEFVGIIGPNGAGKTTILSVVNGLVRPSRGKVETLGFGLPSLFSYRLRRRVGYVAQVENVDPRLPMTVRETVSLGGAGRLGWSRRPGPNHHAAVERALAQTGITQLGSRPLGQLSGGEYQRAAIARVLVQAPELFLFDEPTASIDPRAQRDILRLIHDLHLEGGATALYVTHDLRTLPERCTRLVLMKDGRIWRDGPRNEMLDPALLGELYDAAEGDAAASAPGV